MRRTARWRISVDARSPSRSQREIAAEGRIDLRRAGICCLYVQSNFLFPRRQPHKFTRRSAFEHVVQSPLLTSALARRVDGRALPPTECCWRTCNRFRSNHCLIFERFFFLCRFALPASVGDRTIDVRGVLWASNACVCFVAELFGFGFRVVLPIARLVGSFFVFRCFVFSIDNQTRTRTNERTKRQTTCIDVQVRCDEAATRSS